MPSTQDFLSRARLCNDEFLVCASGRRQKILVYGRQLARKYDIAEELSSISLHRPLVFEASKRTPFLIVRTATKPKWVLVRLDKGFCRRVPTPSVGDLRLVDDFDTNQTFIIGYDSEGKQKNMLISGSEVIAGQDDLAIPSFDFRAVAKKDTKYYHSDDFLPSKDCRIEVIGDSLVSPPWMNLVLKNVVNEDAIEIPVHTDLGGLMAVGNRRVVAVSYEGHVTHSWSVDASGKFREEELSE